MLRGRAGAPALVPPTDPVRPTPLIDVGDAVPLVRHALRSRANTGTGTLGHDVKTSWLNLDQFNCSQIVKPTRDFSPKRSPQAVHTFLAWYFQGKNVVEGGTRVGDGLACWARATNSTTGMEIDRRYCNAVRLRAQTAGYSAKLTMLCRSFFDNTPDADIYTYWAQPPAMTNTKSLKHLALEHQSGRIRGNAEAVVLFEKGDQGDDREFAEWSKFASWSVLVPFDEKTECLSHKGPSLHLCSRAKGVFRIAGFPLKRLPKFTGPPPPPPATPYRNLSRTFTGASPLRTLVVKSKTLNKSSMSK